MSAVLTKYWNPAPVVTHLVDESVPGAARTLCGVEVKDGLESGDEYSPSDAYCGCMKCCAAAAKAARSNP